MLMMFKDILRTLIFTLVPGVIFAFLVMSALPTFKKSGFKNTIKVFFKSLKNKDRLFLFLLLIYFFIVIYRTLFQRDFSYDSLSDVFGGWKIFKTQYTGLDYQVIGNIAMFLPFGLLWALTFERKEKSAKTLLKALLSSLCFSVFIEITHRHIFHTVANLNPLILTHSVAAFAFFSMRQIPENSGADHTDQHNTEG